MRYLKNSFTILNLFIASLILTSCVQDNLDPDNYPGVGEIEDLTLPEAGFTASQSTASLSDTEDPEIDANWRQVFFSNASTSSTKYTWDFGDGSGTSTDIEPSYVYMTEQDTTVYTVTLTALDALGVSSSISEEITVIKPAANASLVPEVLSGDFEGGSGDYPDWRFAQDNEAGYASSPWQNTGNGSFYDYDGVLLDSRTRGAKYDTGNSFPASDGSVRIAYQAFSLTGGRDYVIEFDHRFESDALATDFVYVAVLDGHYTSYTEVLEAGEAIVLTEEFANFPSAERIEFKTFRKSFETPGSDSDLSNVSIVFYGFVEGEAEGYIDNIKLYPAE